MRIRQQLVIDAKTGDATATAELIYDNADAATRMAELKESLPDAGEVMGRFAMALCDGCGEGAELDFESPRMPPGWASCEAGDFCPRCQSLN